MLSLLPLLRALVALVALAACTLAAQCPTYEKVISGVFQPNNQSVNYGATQEVCACYNATVASLENVSKARDNKYETCEWGWVREQKVVLPRVTATEHCGNSSTGVVSRMPCVYIAAEHAFCFNTKAVKGVFQIYDQNNKTNLTAQERFDLCGTMNATVANSEQLDRANQSGYSTCSASWVADWTVYNVNNSPQANCSDDPAANSTGANSTGTNSTGTNSTGANSTGTNSTGTNSTGTNSVFCSGEEQKEVFQLFAQDNSTLTKEEAFDLCKSQNATVASRTEVTKSKNSTFKACSAGWVADWSKYRLKLTATTCPSPPPANSSTNSTKSGNLSVFCFREELMDSGLYAVASPSGSQLLNKTEAKNLCVSRHDNLATVADMKNSSSALLNAGLTGWGQEGIVKTGANGTVDLLPCVNYPDLLAGVYCYDSKLEDTPLPNTIWKKIAMGCILASIFVILLIAALFMKGNQFICCIEKTQPLNTVSSNAVWRETGRVPVWNTTGTYKPVREMVDPVYSSPVILPQPRQPAIRPEMMNYRIHELLDMPPSGEPAIMAEVRYKGGHFYDNLGYDITSEE